MFTAFKNKAPESVGSTPTPSTKIKNKDGSAILICFGYIKDHLEN
jgi:hypothetical protein